MSASANQERDAAFIKEATEALLVEILDDDCDDLQSVRAIARTLRAAGQPTEPVAWLKPGTNLVVHSDIKGDTNRGDEFSIPLARAAGQVTEPVALKLTKHDTEIIRDIEIIAHDEDRGFWPAMLAIGALRLIRNAYLPGVAMVLKDSVARAAGQVIPEPVAAHIVQVGERICHYTTCVRERCRAEERCLAASPPVEVGVTVEARDSTEQALGLYAVQADKIREVLDEHAPHTTGNLVQRVRAALSTPSPLPAPVEPTEMRAEFTDTGRAALMWVLWHHQGFNSWVGQAMRFALGMGRDERLSEWQVAEAKRWEALNLKRPA